VCGLLNGISQYVLLHNLIDLVFQVWLSTIFLQQGFDTAIRLGFLVSIEGVSRHAHDFANL
jgi:hypothetical protein